LLTLVPFTWKILKSHMLCIGYVDKFIGNEFMLRKFKKETMLKARELWGLIDGKNVKLGKSETIAIFAYMQRESHAFNLIVQSL